MFSQLFSTFLHLTKWGKVENSIKQKVSGQKLNSPVCRINLENQENRKTQFSLLSIIDIATLAQGKGFCLRAEETTFCIAPELASCVPQRVTASENELPSNARPRNPATCDQIPGLQLLRPAVAKENHLQLHQSDARSSPVP